MKTAALPAPNGIPARMGTIQWMLGVHVLGLRVSITLEEWQYGGHEPCEPDPGKGIDVSKSSRFERAGSGVHLLAYG